MIEKSRMFVPLWERWWGRRKRKDVMSVTDELVMGEMAGADVGADSGESCPIGLVLHRREEKKKR
jgi:hypothetical protein